MSRIAMNMPNTMAMNATRWRGSIWSACPGAASDVASDVVGIDRNDVPEPRAGASAMDLPRRLYLDAGAPEMETGEIDTGGATDWLVRVSTLAATDMPGLSALWRATSGVTRMRTARRCTIFVKLPVA